MGRKTILIVDDQEINREILKEDFSGDYEVLEAENGKEAFDIITQHHDIVGILLDLEMPVMDGLTLLRRLKRRGLVSRVPVFIVTGNEDGAALDEAYQLGAADYIIKPFRARFYCARINNIIEFYQRRNDLQFTVEDQGRQLNYVKTAMLETLVTLIEFRDCESGDHVHRMCGLTRVLLRKFAEMNPQYHLNPEEIEKIVLAATMHDVGKIAVPDAILKKPGRLTAEEFEIIKTHTVKGSEILARVPNILDRDVFEYSTDICRHHHERYDGKGYPDGLKGDQITPWAQIVALADVYDALTNDRCYKKAYSHEEAVRMIHNGECGTFNPDMLHIFNRAIEEIMHG